MLLSGIGVACCPLFLAMTKGKEPHFSIIAVFMFILMWIIICCDIALTK